MNQVDHISKSGSQQGSDGLEHRIGRRWLESTDSDGRFWWDSRMRVAGALAARRKAQNTWEWRRREGL